MNGILKALERYAKILGGEASPQYLACKEMAVERIPDSLDEKWALHDKLVAELRGSGNGGASSEKPDVSLLDLKSSIANDILQNCEFCERRCAVDRTAGQRGHCGILEPRISSEFMHYGEEPELVPSYTIFFSGCTFNCVFCQNFDISQNADGGEKFPAEGVAHLIERREEIAKNVNWVGGDPTSNLAFILEVLAISDSAIPQVWNSNMFLTPESLKLLDGVIDVYLTDFKYGNDECAKRLSGIENYWQIATRNHMLAREQAEVIIRHLVMPGHIKCCSKPILNWLAENFGDRVRVNVMAQYRPMYKAFRYPEINRSLKRHEFAEAYEHAFSLGLNLVE